jgi:hypothetical protein
MTIASDKKELLADAAVKRGYALRRPKGVSILCDIISSASVAGRGDQDASTLATSRGEPIGLAVASRTFQNRNVRWAVVIDSFA